MLRSRPTCLGLRRTVIDISRESLVFHFVCIILRLDPCRTGPFLITDLAPTPSRLIGLMTRTPSHALPHGQSRSFVIFILFPLDVIAYQFLTIRPLPLTLTIRKAIRYWLSPLHDGHSPYL